MRERLKSWVGESRYLALQRASRTFWAAFLAQMGVLVTSAAVNEAVGDVLVELPAGDFIPAAVVMSAIAAWLNRLASRKTPIER